MTPDDCMDASALAVAGADTAAGVRRGLRQASTPGAAEREQEIALALDGIDRVMRPIRSMRGKLVWEPMPSKAERALAEASARCQYERKQLKKMRRG